MVILFALYPLAAAAAVVVLDRLVPLGLVTYVTSSPTFSAALSAVVLAAIIVAALRQRNNVVLLSAWLFLFCGELILTLGYVMEPFVPPGSHWIEEVFEIVSFFPLLVFVAYVASPMRLLMLPRARMRMYPVLGALLLIGAAAVAFVPWVVGLESTRLTATPESLLHLPQALLDIVLLEPLALVLLAIGVSPSGLPYLFLGVGLMLLLPEDLLFGYGILSSGGILGSYAHLAFVVSQLYILNGTLLACARFRPEPDAEPAQTG